MLYSMNTSTDAVFNMYEASLRVIGVRGLLRRLREWLPVPRLLKHEKTGRQKDYANIGPTAALIAYYRSCSDIPFARQLAYEIGAESASRQMIVDDSLLLAKAIVAFEARFKSVDAVLRRYPGITRFIEIPAGFSTRGLTMTRSNPCVEYVECDLEAMLTAKRRAVAQLIADMGERQSDSLRFQAANILDPDQLHLAAHELSSGPIGIITEGLLSYLNRDEKRIAAGNIHQLLKSCGGVWVITDLTRVFATNDARAAELRHNISVLTGFSPITGCFNSLEEARRFFEGLGFRVHDYRRSDVIDKLSAVAASRLTSSEILAFLETQATFALEAE